MFDKILIANRGEIACRVMATARRMGVATVAVYSDADAHAAHVAMADQAVHIGAAPVAESYLLGDRIIQAALDTGAQAIHPGYGFLSENPDFVEAVEKAGLVFIGPTADAIRAMGLKDAAKALMETAGVPVVPGYHGEEQNPDFLAGEADAIGYPVLIKARAGGGGKGMRLVEDAAAFKTALEGAQREGQASFGDPACLIEKYITQPRHVEIQVFGDAHGNVVHLFERDCSLQRRHQKVIEEAPAPDMPADVRAAMGHAAVEAAKAIGYRGAGTVEFIVDGSRGLRADGFWFMEMNTRLQVEHPVTEAITGLDLVELQLRVAAGEPLPFQQDDLTITGHAFEARIYAEDVPKGFLPATGTLDHLSFPAGVTFDRGAVRIDAGVRAGDTITPYYDPMIAKLIVHGKTRAEALAMLRRALADCHVAGSTSNLEFLSALAAHEGFGNGDVDTGLIGRDLEALTTTAAPSELQIAVAAVLSQGLVAKNTPETPWDGQGGWHQWTPLQHQAVLDHAETRLERQVTVKGSGQMRIDGGAGPVEVTVTRLKNGSFRVQTPDGQAQMDLVRHGDRITLFDGPQVHVFSVPDPLAGAGEADAGGDAVIAPMPGLVKLVSASAGQAVSKGDPLLVLEAMKMEHTLTAPRDGIVAEVMTTPETQVTEGAVLLALVSEEE